MSKPSWLNQEITSESLPTEDDITQAGTYIIRRINELLNTVTTDLDKTSQSAINEVKKENELLLKLLEAAKRELNNLSNVTLASDKKSIIANQ